MANATLADIVPERFGPWISHDVSNLVDARSDNSLEARLYNQTMERVYTNEAEGVELMVLLAHGDTQSNALQLHRPEVCYPAFGFDILSNTVAALKLGQGAALPVRQLVAAAPGRRENIIYWTRLGEFLPTSGAEQRADRFQTVLHGYIGDGLLARFSLVSGEAPAAMATLHEFVTEFVAASNPLTRKALIGTRLANLLDHRNA